MTFHRTATSREKHFTIQDEGRIWVLTMAKEEEVLSGKVGGVSLRRLNHGFADTLIITRLDGSRFAFQNTVLALDGEDEIGTITMRKADEKFGGEEEISSPSFEVDRVVKRLFFSEGGVEYPVGFVIFPESRLPIILAPGSIFGSLSILGFETRGRENGLEFSPADYMVR